MMWPFRTLADPEGGPLVGADLRDGRGPAALRQARGAIFRRRKFDIMSYIRRGPRAKKGSVGLPQPLWRRARAVWKFFSGKFRKILTETWACLPVFDAW